MLSCIQCCSYEMQIPYLEIHGIHPFHHRLLIRTAPPSRTFGLFAFFCTNFNIFYFKVSLIVCFGCVRFFFISYLHDCNLRVRKNADDRPTDRYCWVAAVWYNTARCRRYSWCCGLLMRLLMVVAMLQLLWMQWSRDGQQPRRETVRCCIKSETPLIRTT